jgi:hypothetical protein
MTWLLLSRKDRQRARGWAAAAVAAFLSAGWAGGRSFPPSPVFWGVAGFVAYIFCMRRAMALWRVDDMVFDHRPQWNPEPRHPSKDAVPMALQRSHVARVAVLALLGAAAAASARGQQTIFNVPTADVLGKGKLYLETDWLWRPSDPAFAAGAPIRGVYGFGGNVEGGINFAGIVTPGRSVPVAIPNVKWQPLQTEVVSLTAGALGQFFLRGSSDGTPSVLTYGHAAVKLPFGTRLTAGGWWASSGYAAPNATAGGLFGFEQPITPNLTLAADWYTGHNSLGYVSPGVIVTAGRWVLYAAYSFKNSDSKGNGLLLELGFNVP